MSSVDTSRYQKVFAFVFCSLDGYHEDTDGRLAWNSRFIDRDFFDWNLRQNQSVGALLLGRRTYDHFAEFWPSAEAAEHAPETAHFMNTVPKLVVTHGAPSAPWAGSTFVDGTDLVSEVASLRGATSGDVAVFGSSALTTALLDQGLVDELRVLVHPILLGGGRTVYAGLQRHVALEHTAVTTYRSGNVLLTYRPAAPLP